MSYKDADYELIKGYKNEFEGDRQRMLMMNATIKSGIDAVAVDYKAAVNTTYTFSVDITTGDITNQKSSGRCWLFAGLNVMRWHIMQKLNLKTFELSQNYQMFWDKFEKANFFLNSIIETIDEPTDSRIINWLLQSPVQDGGQWDMFINLVEKYGVVPKEKMPETFHSGNTRKLNWVLTLKLRGCAAKLRDLYKSGMSADELWNYKEDMLRDIYFILCQSLGTPPDKFDFEARDKDEKFIRDMDITPLEFVQKNIDINLDDYISIISAPTEDKPFNHTYTVKFLGNVEGKPVKYLNVDVPVMKQLAIVQMENGEPVWFGCDVGKWLERDNGIMDMDQFDYSGALGVDIGMDKAGRLDYGESQMTHAMVFTGVNIIDGVPNRWKVENSWGDTNGKKGIYVMNDNWFGEYMYQIVVKKSYLSEELLSALDTEPIELKPWDPMGSLA